MSVLLSLARLVRSLSSGSLTLGALVWAVAGLGCDFAALTRESTDAGVVGGESGRFAKHLHEPILADGLHRADTSVDPSLTELRGFLEAEFPTEATPPAVPVPVDHRIARQKLTVYAAPRSSAPVRGRILQGRAFEVFAELGADLRCEAGWADVGNGGYVCLDDTRAAGDARPEVEPPMLGHDGLTPHLYAKVEDGKVARRWSSLAAFSRGDEPTGMLVPKHDYAFVGRKVVHAEGHGGQMILIDARGGVVLEREVQRFRPSRFAGRDLAIEPVPEGMQLAWAIEWPKAIVRRDASVNAPVIAELGYHDELVFALETSEKGDWVALEHGGFVRASSLRVWSLPPARPADVAEGELWLDVDLQSQILTVMVGATPVYATLVSAGFKAPTPRGVFRIRNKQAVGAMASGPGEADFYSVEAVPFIQYFAGGFAVHGAYWHDAFGRAVSHGCVNLSPIDARHVFSLTTPGLSGGWIHAYETEVERGTVIRIRRGDASVPDRRGPVEPVLGL